jgi:hypothetical protein
VAEEEAKTSGKTDFMNGGETENSIKGELDWQKVRREKPKCSGVYIEGSVQGKEVLITIDTGATRTFMSKRVYENLPCEGKPECVANSDSKPMTGADGKFISHFGRAVFTLDLCPLTIDRTIIVVDIEDEVLLGADILIRDPGGPADLLLSRNLMVFNRVEIPLIKIGPPYQARRVIVADHFTCIVPAPSEKGATEENPDVADTFDSANRISLYQKISLI